MLCRKRLKLLLNFDITKKKKIKLDHGKFLKVIKVIEKSRNLRT